MLVNQSMRPEGSGHEGLPIVVHSHLRWDFVWQRPQHLLSRAANHYNVLVIEEPIFKPGISAHMDVSDRPQGVTIAVPMLPEGLSHEDVIAEQHDLIEALIGREALEAPELEAARDLGVTAPAMQARHDQLVAANGAAADDGIQRHRQGSRGPRGRRMQTGGGFNTPRRSPWH